MATPPPGFPSESHSRLSQGARTFSAAGQTDTSTSQSGLNAVTSRASQPLMQRGTGSYPYVGGAAMSGGGGNQQAPASYYPAAGSYQHAGSVAMSGYGGNQQTVAFPYQLEDSLPMAYPTSHPTFHPTSHPTSHPTDSRTASPSGNQFSNMPTFLIHSSALSQVVTPPVGPAAMAAPVLSSIRVVPENVINDSVDTLTKTLNEIKNPIPNFDSFERESLIERFVYNCLQVENFLQHSCDLSNATDAKDTLKEINKVADVLKLTADFISGKRTQPANSDTNNRINHNIKTLGAATKNLSIKIAEYASITIAQYVDDSTTKSASELRKTLDKIKTSAGLCDTAQHDKLTRLFNDDEFHSITQYTVTLPESTPATSNTASAFSSLPRLRKAKAVHPRSETPVLSNPSEQALKDISHLFTSNLSTIRAALRHPQQASIPEVDHFVHWCKQLKGNFAFLQSSSRPLQLIKDMTQILNTFKSIIDVTSNQPKPSNQDFNAPIKKISEAIKDLSITIAGNASYVMSQSRYTEDYREVVPADICAAACNIKKVINAIKNAEGQQDERGRFTRLFNDDEFHQITRASGVLPNESSTS